MNDIINMAMGDLKAIHAVKWTSRNLIRVLLNEWRTELVIRGVRLHVDSALSICM